MYDILQLNDMLVPELLDIAEQLKIPAAKKLSKQELVYKILDRQAVVSSEGSADLGGDKPKRKRIIKTVTANSNEEAIVESGDDKSKKDPKKEIRKKEEKPLIKKIKKKDDHQDDSSESDDQPQSQQDDEPQMRQEVLHNQHGQHEKQHEQR